MRAVAIQEAVKVLGQKFLMQEGVAGISHRSEQIFVYVESPEVAERVPPALMGFPVKVVVSGRFYALGVGRTLAGLQGDKRWKWRPSPGGVSVGHPLVTAGTLACRVYDVATGARLFLSNNHVIAASNRGRPGDPVLQPGRADGGSDPADRLGLLERFVEIKSPPDVNLVDAAVARPIRDGDLSDEVLDIGVVNDYEEPLIGMRVAKSGRTTCYREATIEDASATVKVWGYPWGYSIFEDQVITTGLGLPGDSGSLVVNVATKKAVGLLFAGSYEGSTPILTILNKTSHVLRLLNVSLSPTAPRPAPAIPPLWTPLAFISGLILVGSSAEVS